MSSHRGTAATVPTGPPTGPRTADPAMALLRGGAVPALVAGAVLAAAVARAGLDAVVGSVLGTVLVCVAMSTGPFLMRTTRRWTPPAVMAVSLLSFGAVVVVLGMVHVALAGAAWLSSGHLATSLIACGAAWTVGESWAAWRLRVLAFGDVVASPTHRRTPVDADAPSGSGRHGSFAPGGDGDTGSELPNSH